MMIFCYKFSNPLCEISLVNTPFFPDVENVFSPRNIVPIIDVSCDFVGNVLELGLVIFFNLF